MSASNSPFCSDERRRFAIIDSDYRVASRLVLRVCNNRNLTVSLRFARR